MKFKDVPRGWGFDWVPGYEGEEPRHQKISAQYWRDFESDDDYDYRWQKVSRLVYNVKPFDLYPVYPEVFGGALTRYYKPQEDAFDFRAVMYGQNHKTFQTY